MLRYFYQSQYFKGVNMLKKLILYTLLIFSCIHLLIENSSAAVFQHQTDKNFSYIFVPGIISMETQTAKYIPEFVGSFGETVVCSGGIHTLNQPISTCTFSEISIQPLNNQSRNPFVYLGYWITNMQNKKYGVSVQRSGQPGQDAIGSGYTAEKHAFDWTKINFAQESDINALFKAYTEHIEKYPATKVVLYGVSRGAAVICPFLAKYQPQNIGGAVLEAPFDSIPHLLKHSSKTSFFNSFLNLNALLPKVTGYDPNGDSPIKSIENISKEIPILIVASDLDDVVPVECAESLMRRFGKLGYHKVHFLRLNKSTHSGYAYDDAADRTKYETVTHAFYKHYGLPYDETLALQGADEWKKISGQSTLMPPVN